MEIIKTSHAVTGCFCLLLLAVLVWQLAGGDSFKPGRPFGPPDLAESAQALDSFSEPSVGLAVLKQEAEHLMLAYYDKRDQVRASQTGLLQNSSATGGRAVPGSGSSSPAALNSPAAREVSALELIAKLRPEVQDLEVDLNQKLMRAYSENDSSNEFLDCYLRLVGQATECPPGVAIWTLDALGCARKCGRAEEVADTLHHIIRFHPQLQIAALMRAALEQWEAQNLPGSEVSKR